MTDQDERFGEQDRRLKRAAAEADEAARDKARRERYLAREKAIEEATKPAVEQRAEKRAAEEIARLARGQARRDAFLAKERAMSEAHEARRAKEREQLPE